MKTVEIVIIKCEDGRMLQMSVALWKRILAAVTTKELS